MGTPSHRMLPDYNIVSQATKVGIDRNGVITFRAGYGTVAPEMWHQVFRQLASY